MERLTNTRHLGLCPRLVRGDRTGAASGVRQCWGYSAVACVGLCLVRFLFRHGLGFRECRINDGGGNRWNRGRGRWSAGNGRHNRRIFQVGNVCGIQQM